MSRNVICKKKSKIIPTYYVQICPVYTRYRASRRMPLQKYSLYIYSYCKVYALYCYLLYRIVRLQNTLQTEVEAQGVDQSMCLRKKHLELEQISFLMMLPKVHIVPRFASREI